MRRRLTLLIALAAALAALSPDPAGASSRMLVGVYDESQTFGNPNWAFTQYRLLGVRILRVNLYWGGPAGVARRRPANPVNPNDPAYNWELYDRTVKLADENDIKIIFSIFGTPSWANGGKLPNRAPTRAGDLEKFAYAAAKRYSGSFRPSSTDPDSLPLPAVRYWLAWNEPNNPIFLKPQFKRVGRHFVPQSPRDYARICNAIWTGVHITGFANEEVACGATAPRGSNSGFEARPSISPIYFIRQLSKVRVRFDAYAHHPYYGARNETPTALPRGPHAIVLGNISRLIGEVTRHYGRKPIWITEYGYQTRPPDRLFGVSWTAQARYLTEAFNIARRNRRIDMMLWFLVRDDIRIGSGWQSGFYTASGRRKPSFRAYQRVRK